ncbi:MAG: sorting and assembly machinery component 50 [Clostridium sp.]|nr:sorting and assembly machinery component 50 [Clostridium sp.]
MRILILMAAALLWSCSSTKHVPDGRLLLNKVSIRVDGDSIKPGELYNYLRQTPNHKVLGFAKMQLGIYSLSGRDSTKWYNRWLQKIGQPPVIFDPSLTAFSEQQLRQALVNKGYLHAEVDVDSAANHRKKRIDITYNVHPGQPMRIAHVRYEIPDSAVAAIFYADTAALPAIDGQLLDRTLLDQYRTDIAALLRRKGYYAFAKDYVTFVADTVAGSTAVALTMHINPPRQQEKGVNEEIAEAITPDATVIEDHFSMSESPEIPDHHTYRLRHVYFVTDYDSQRSGAELNFPDCDTVDIKGLKVLYGPDRYITPGILEEKCHLHPGELYNTRDVENTYEALNQLGILRYVNIVFKPVADYGLDAYILLSRNKKQGITFELEGTNSEGDLGFGAGITYQHRNLAKRSNLLTVKVRGAYEHLSGKSLNIINNRYTEFAGEVGITFPKFEFPFLTSEYKRRRRASTEFAISGNYQERPEYTRIIAGAAWRYKWSHSRGTRRTRYQFDLIDINYVRLPKSTLNFLDSIAPANPLLRYSYEDHFIMRTGISVYLSNRRIPSASLGAPAFQPRVRTFHGSLELAGNALYALSKLTGQKKSDGAYKVFGIQYAQYFKAEADYTYSINFNQRHSLNFHAGGGVAVPYLNSEMVPFEKRFYAGGANGVRGWGVRTLGPGSYDSKNSVTNFINQCGDILLNLNMEYRAKLFWVFEGALFVDAGNVWTIRSYENQPGGVFRFDKFYKQLAASYGMGLRLDFTYFLLRLDLGVKAHNPATNQASWPLFHPSWRRDVNFHFAVGYPF